MSDRVLKDRQMVIDYLMDNFHFTFDMAVNWINSNNPNFGLSSPEELIKADRTDKVMLFMIAAKEGY